MSRLSGLSLLDLEGAEPIRYLLVYPQGEQRRAWWTFFLPDDFDHVDVWRPLGQGFYLVFSAYHDYLMVDLIEGEPSGVVQPVTAKRVRGKAMFPVGLKTCVTLAKAALGIRNPFVITPKQLYQYVEKRKGIV